jgi:hypothetical protein
MNSILVITTSNTETTNNNISIYSNDLREGDLCIPYPVVQHIYGYVNSIFELPEIIKDILTQLGKEETFIKRVLLVLTLMDKHPESWCSKDAELQASVAGLLILLYKSQQTHIEELMFGVSDRLMDAASSGKIRENYFKNAVDITMRLKSIFKELDKFNLLIEPKGSWVEFNGKKFLKLSYN